MIARFAETLAFDMGIPVFTGLKSGHGVDQRIVPLCTAARLNLREGELLISTGVETQTKGRRT